MMEDNGDAGNAKLIQYLTEAHGKETELLESLAAHIQIATRPVYKKRLQDHLKETRQHAKLVQRQVKKLGGDVGSGVVSKAATAAVGVPKLAAAGVKGAGHVLRGTGEEEKQLKNAKTEYFNEHEEIANYRAIEALATALGDKDTAKIAKGIRREEERMAAFLEKQIPMLTKEVVKAEVPKSGRARASGRSTGRSTASKKSRAGRSASSGAKKPKKSSTSSKRKAKRS